MIDLFEKHFLKGDIVSITIKTIEINNQIGIIQYPLELRSTYMVLMGLKIWEIHSDHITLVKR